jgi:hypothetical protein
VLVGLQGIVVAVLTLITFMARTSQRRLPPAGFPHLESPQSELDGNHLQFYSYGRELYPAMLEAIDRA